jgi:hypothetical protein
MFKMKATYENIPKMIEERKSFNGSSVHAHTGLTPNEYFVYSYATAILIVQSDNTIVFDNRRYSNTTEKLQHILRNLLKCPPVISIGPRGGKHLVRTIQIYNPDTKEWTVDKIGF